MNSPPANNLIFFPKVPVRNIPQSLDEIMQTVSSNRRKYADYITSRIFQEILRAGEIEGFNLETEANTPDLVLAYEAIKSLFYMGINQEHTLQSFARNSIVLIEALPEDEGTDDNS